MNIWHFGLVSQTQSIQHSQIQCPLSLPWHVTPVCLIINPKTKRMATCKSLASLKLKLPAKSSTPIQPLLSHLSLLCLLIRGSLKVLLACRCKSLGREHVVVAWWPSELKEMLQRPVGDLDTTYPVISCHVLGASVCKHKRMQTHSS